MLNSWMEYTILFFILLLLSAFFSGVETAVFFANRLKIRHLVKKGNQNARLVAQFQDKPESFLSVILVGNNMVNVIMASVASIAFFKLMGEKGVWVSSFIVTVVVLIFGEILPKSVSAYMPDRIAVATAPITALIYKVVFPFVRFITMFISQILKALGFSGKDHRKMTEDDIHSMFTLAQDEGVLSKEKAILYNNIWKLTDISAREVMVPKSEVVTLPVNISFKDCLDIIREHKYSRFPVYEDIPENVIGVIHTKDIIEFCGNEDAFSIGKAMRAPLFVPDIVSIYNVFELLKKEHVHLGCIVDEYGNFEGIVTMENILEEIVGEIRDEYDFDESAPVRAMDESTFLVDGNTSIREVNRALGTKLSEEETTISGLIFLILGRLPRKEEEIPHEGLSIKIKSVQGSKIRRVVIRKNA